MTTGSDPEVNRQWTGSGPFIHLSVQGPEKSGSLWGPGYIHEMNKQECEGSKSEGRLRPTIFYGFYDNHFWFQRNFCHTSATDDDRSLFKNG